MKEKILKLKNKISNAITEIFYCHFEAIIICIIIIIFLFMTYIFQYSNYSEAVIEIKDKFVKTYNGNGTYIITDNNDNTYKIEDLLFIWKFNSTDIYSSIEIGGKYKIYTTGIRFKLFSQYPNINKIEKIEE